MNDLLPDNVSNSVSEDYVFHTCTKDAWDAVYRKCEAAQTEIICEQYIFNNDEVGNRFLDIFIKKAEEGVKIRLLLDRFGSRTLYDTEKIRRIEELGGKVVFYHDMGWYHLLAPWTWLPRTHLKLFIIDRKTAFIGGVCLIDTMADWYDIFFEISGKAVNIFPFSQSLENKEKFSTPDISKEIDGLSYGVSNPKLTRPKLYHDLLVRVRQAEKRIYLTSPYFMPPKRFKEALVNAAKRGVDVKIVMTEKSDIPVACSITKSFLPPILRKGVKVFAHTNTPCHAKFILIDDDWGMLGSTNLDYLSLIHNREGNVFIKNKAILHKMDQIFAESLKKCEQLDEYCWKELSFHEKAKAILLRPIKKFL
jgi:cardiolipin synthase